MVAELITSRLKVVKNWNYFQCHHANTAPK